MRQLAQLCEAIAGTTKKLEKTSLVADYLRSRAVDEAAVSALFLSGKPFPAREETTLQVGGRSLWQVVAELSGKSDSELNAAYRRSGDLGTVAGDVLPPHGGPGLGVLEVERTFREIASARGAAAKATLVRDLLTRATPLEAKYIVKIVTGDLRIGLKESLVEEAIAKAFGHTFTEVQRAPTCFWAISAKPCAWQPKVRWQKQKCASSIPLDSCSPAPSNLRKKA
jgi:DNA ligase-1